MRRTVGLAVVGTRGDAPAVEQRDGVGGLQRVAVAVGVAVGVAVAVVALARLQVFRQAAAECVGGFVLAIAKVDT